MKHTTHFHVNGNILRALSRQLVPNAGTLVLVALLLCAYHAWAAPGVSPQADAAISDVNTGLLSYQGYLTDASGTLLDNDVGITFRLYSAPTGGTALWTEAHTGANAVPVDAGLFNVMLGSLTPIPSDVWSNDMLYLGVQVGNDAEMMPREVVGAVPVALNVPASTEWGDLPLAEGLFSPPNSGWQKAQYRKIGDIVYLRGLVTKNGWVNIDNQTVIGTLPAGFRPPINVAFAAEPHNFLTTKHRVDIRPDGTVIVGQSAGATPYVSLDGIFFSVSP